MCVCVWGFVWRGLLYVTEQLRRGKFAQNVYRFYKSVGSEHRATVCIGCCNKESHVLPHTAVFMCFVWISEQTAIISLYNINWLVFVTETESVYCAVQTECLNTIPRSAHTAVFMCFVWISEQTAIISLYSINWLVFVTETESVYCAVRTVFSYIICINSSFMKFIVTNTHTHISVFQDVQPQRSYTLSFKSRTVQLIWFQLLQESLPRNESRRKFLLPVQTALRKVVLEYLTVTQLVENFPASKELQGSHSVRNPDTNHCAARLHSAHNLTHSHNLYVRSFLICP